MARCSCLVQTSTHGLIFLQGMSCAWSDMQCLLRLAVLLGRTDMQLCNAEDHGFSYAPGADIDFHVAMNAHHWGRFQYRVCPIDFVDEVNDCILMKRWVAFPAVVCLGICVPGHLCAWAAVCL
jgi:hypothetical protein